ncbi:MAG: hypothetical protein ACLQDL_03960 [Spirochaetia bacterium]
MRAVEPSPDPVSRFASRLLETPALRLLPALQKEEQALNVLRINGPQLIPVFTSLGMDVSRGWREPAALISRSIRAEADRLAAAEIARLLTERLVLSFFPGLTGGRQAPARAREELRALILRAAAHPVARSALAGSLAAALSDLMEKYIPQAWERKKYTYVEITRVQHLSLSPSDLSDLTRCVVLLRPVAYLYVTPGETADKDVGYSPLQEQYLSKILPGIASQAASLPRALLSMGLRSTLAFPGGGSVEAISRLGAVMAMRGRTLSPGAVIDRGADTADKSWFNVQRRNARWHGLDGRMLDELYTIAAENGW